MAYGQGADPRTATLIDTTTVSGPGFLLTNDSTNNKLDLCAATEVPLGVSVADSSRDADNVLETANATISYYPLGGMFLLASDAVTYSLGQLVYANNAGRVTNVAGSNKKVGIYVGNGETATAGDLVPVSTTTAADA
tara:strand:- start:7192 stop:7602 length:411 start_codon:yes stop_codon:yes gene_type:complete